VNFTSLRCYGLILVVKTFKKRFLNINAGSAALARYESPNDYVVIGKGVSIPLAEFRNPDTGQVMISFEILCLGFRTL
jgi:hypothetical protein